MPIDELIEKLKALQKLYPEAEVEVRAYGPKGENLDGDPLFYANVRHNLGQNILLVSDQDTEGQAWTTHWEDWMASTYIMRYREVKP